jgi:thiol-disulfide isomerase/thioredoxin
MVIGPRILKAAARPAQGAGEGQSEGWRRRDCLPALAAGVLGAAVWPVATRAAVPGEADASGAPASVTSAGRAIEWPPLRSVAGQELPPAHWAGVPAVVVFWATWCGFCRRHNAHLDRLQRSVDASRLRILGVALDRNAADVQRYLQQTGYGFTAVADGAALRERFTSRRVIPMTCTVGADGRLLQAIPGEMSADDVLALARLALPAR